MILGKYNQSKTITFDLVAPDGVDLIINATFAAGDLKIMKDEGAEANTTNLPTDEGTGYSLVLTATEMSAARIRVYVIDQTATKIWLDVSLGLETYGNASAEHAFDLDTAAETMRGTDNALLAASINLTGGAVDTVTTLTNLPSIPANWLTASGIAASALNGKGDWNIGKTGYSLTQSFPTNFADMSISVTTGLVDITQTAADKVWGTAARILTASTNFNDLSAAQVNTECDTALTDYGGPTNAEMEARTPTAAQLLYITRHAATALPVTFTGGTTTTAILGNVDGVAASSTDDVYNSRLLVFNAGTLGEQVCQITDYVGLTKTATISAVTTAVTSGHTAVLV